MRTLKVKSTIINESVIRAQIKESEKIVEEERQRHVINRPETIEERVIRRSLVTTKHP